jgi:hypothetical protein
VGAAEPTSWIAAATSRGRVILFIVEWMVRLQSVLRDRVLIDTVYIPLTGPYVYFTTVTLRMEPPVEADVLPGQAYTSKSSV